eukprot:6188357-Pleurochrysis_carterae.AAC.1
MPPLEKEALTMELLSRCDQDELFRARSPSAAEPQRRIAVQAQAEAREFGLDAARDPQVAVLLPQ